MNDLQIFKNEHFGDIRVIAEDGKTLFNADDVAQSLGYANSRKAVSDHCRCVTKRYIPHPQSSTKQIEVNFINEADLYRLIVGSTLPSATQFEMWVFEEVLPSIRNNGGYIVNQESLTPEQIVANALIVAQNIIQQKDKQLAEMKPKAEYFDELVERNLLTNFRDTAKELGIKEKDFIDFLMVHRYVYRDNHRKLRPYADKNKGLFELKEFTAQFSEHAGVQTLITPKGRETFRLLIKGIA